MPKSARHTAHGYYNGSPSVGASTRKCWRRILQRVLFGRVHQLTVDTYAVQHAGGLHPDKSVTVHLTVCISCWTAECVQRSCRQTCNNWPGRCGSGLILCRRTTGALLPYSMLRSRIHWSATSTVLASGVRPFGKRGRSTTLQSRNSSLNICRNPRSL